MGFQEDVEQILEDVPVKRQTMLFSATMPQWVKKLADKYCDNFTMVDLVGSGRDSGLILFVYFPFEKYNALHSCPL